MRDFVLRPVREPDPGISSHMLATAPSMGSDSQALEFANDLDEALRREVSMLNAQRLREEKLQVLLRNWDHSWHGINPGEEDRRDDIARYERLYGRTLNTADSFWDRKPDAQLFDAQLPSAVPGFYSNTPTPSGTMPGESHLGFSDQARRRHDEEEEFDTASSTHTGVLAEQQPSWKARVYFQHSLSDSISSEKAKGEHTPDTTATEHSAQDASRSDAREGAAAGATEASKRASTARSSSEVNRAQNAKPGPAKTGKSGAGEDGKPEAVITSCSTQTGAGTAGNSPGVQGPGATSTNNTNSAPGPARPRSLMQGIRALDPQHAKKGATQPNTSTTGQKLGSDDIQGAAWRWRFTRRWQAEQQRAHMTPSATDDVLKGLLQGSHAVNDLKRTLRKSNNGRKDSGRDDSLIFSQLDVDSSLCSEKGASSALRNSVDDGLAHAVNDLEQQAGVIEQETEKLWHQAGLDWAGKYLPIVSISPAHRSIFGLFRVMDSQGHSVFCMRSTDHRSSLQALMQALQQELKAICTTHRLPSVQVLPMCTGAMQWRLDRDRDLLIMRERVQPLNQGDSRDYCAHLSASIAEAGLPVGHTVRVN